MSNSAAVQSSRDKFRQKNADRRRCRAHIRDLTGRTSTSETAEARYLRQTVHGKFGRLPAKLFNRFAIGTLAIPRQPAVRKEAEDEAS